MPTGYTYDVAEGKVTTLQEFACNCARAFGAFIHLRDEPSRPVTRDDLKDMGKYSIDEYHVDALKEALKEKKKFDKLSYDQILKIVRADKTRRIKEAVDNIGRITLENKRLDDMINQVLAWQEPSDEHYNFKSFMLQQLRDSKSSVEYYVSLKTEWEDYTDDELVQNRKDMVARNVEYHSKAIEEGEKKRAKRVDPNLWATQLFDSLGMK